MTLPAIPSLQLLPKEAIPADPAFGGLRIVRYQTNPEMQKAFLENRFEFQHELGKRHIIHGVTLALKGAPPNYRITATMHPTLREFKSIVQYDPSAPPPDQDYEALGMKEVHDETQQEFKGAKLKNLGDYKQYNIEAIRGERVAYLPTVSGWQSSVCFDDTIFVALDETLPKALYGILFLPIKPVMQSDGQTQTAALFQAAASGIAIKSGALDNFGTTLEIELNVTRDRASQSFADRNGRGSKKNTNLVVKMDTSSPLARIRELSIEGTMFKDRMADGRTGGATETNTQNIVDLSTMQQMLLNVISRGTKKPEHIKQFHVEYFLPYCQEFIRMLEELFGNLWAHPTPKGSEPYRRLYVHGWAYALKALAIAYHDARRDALHPLAAAIGSSGGKDDHTTQEEAKEAFLKATQAVQAPDPVVTFDELKSRLQKIDWLRWRQHWTILTGVKFDKKGQPKVRTIKTPDGPKRVVDSKAENSAGVIKAVATKIVSDSWADLTADIDTPVPPTA